MNSSAYIDIEEKDILILGERPRHRFGDTTLTAQVICPINFPLPNRRFVLRLHQSTIGSNSFLFVNATKICQFKAKISEKKGYALCLGNISKDFTFDNMKKA